MADLLVKLDREGVRALLRSPEMLALCKELANTTAGRLGAGYKVTSRTGKNRVNAEIAAVSRKARRENMQHNTILKALRG